MNRGVANNPALADFSASRFELRLDERNQACGRRRKAEGPLQHLRKRDEAGITDNKINGLRDMLPRQNPGAGLLMDDHPVILPKFPGTLVGAAIDRIDPRRAFGQQHVGEAAGRASYIHRSEANTTELQSLLPITYADFRMKKKNKITH